MCHAICIRHVTTTDSPIGNDLPVAMFVVEPNHDASMESHLTTRYNAQSTRLEKRYCAHHWHACFRTISQRD